MRVTTSHLEPRVVHGVIQQHSPIHFVTVGHAPGRLPALPRSGHCQAAHFVGAASAAMATVAEWPAAAGSPMNRLPQSAADESALTGAVSRDQSKVPT
jgi:hypothetical protein